MESYLVGIGVSRRTKMGLTNGLEKQNMAVHWGTNREEGMSVISMSFNPRRTEKV